jgi:hypothetical protein
MQTSTKAETVDEHRAAGVWVSKFRALTFHPTALYPPAWRSVNRVHYAS